MARAYRLAQIALTLCSLAIAMTIQGCEDPPPPPNYGMLIVGLRTELPSSPAVLSGGVKEDLEGLTGLRATVSRIDVVHRTVADDPATETVVTVDNELRSVEFLDNVAVESSGLFAFLNVPAGFVFQIRFIVDEATIVLRGEEHSVKVPSGAQSGLKVVPIDDVPFEVIAAERTAARIVFRPFKQLIRNKGQGFMFKPVMEAEHLSLAELSPILLDRVVVGFAEGVARAEIDDINADVGASIINQWEPTNYYVMKLPTSISLEEALEYYDDLDEVDFALPDTLIYQRAAVHPCDTGFQNPGPFTVAKFPEAWDVARHPTYRK